VRAAIFVGPTLAGDPVLASPHFEWLPPAAEGDVYRAARRKVAAIGLIDGLFETVPSVWHKEVLWALSRGIPVFGAASMGALRAAELADFGMVGVGMVYRQFKAGKLQDDDEVTVLHAPRELGYRPLTDAMVDIRATLALARRRQIVSQRAAKVLLHIAKNMFFKDRVWSAIISEASRSRVSRSQLGRFSRWLPANSVEQKRRDALAMVRAMRDVPAGRSAGGRPCFKFQHTDFWQELVRTHATR
jgi:hypothetical protein